MTPSAQFFNNSPYVQGCSLPMKLFAFTNGCITSMFETEDTDIYDILLKAKCDIMSYKTLLDFHQNFPTMNLEDSVKSVESMKLHKGAINSLANYFGFKFKLN